MNDDRAYDTSERSYILLCLLITLAMLLVGVPLIWRLAATAFEGRN